MMRYDGLEFGFMGFMFLFWMALLIVLAIFLIRMFTGHGTNSHGPGWQGGPGGPSHLAQPMSPEEILDLRFARGEIDADTYQTHRALLQARHTPKP